MNPNNGPENCQQAMSVAEKHFKIPMVLGTIWNKTSKITIFGHKHFKQKIISNFDIFPSILVHIWNWIIKFEAMFLLKYRIKFEENIVVVTKKCYYSNTTKFILFYFFSRTRIFGFSTFGWIVWNDIFILFHERRG